MKRIFLLECRKQRRIESNIRRKRRGYRLANKQFPLCRQRAAKALIRKNSLSLATFDFL